jgi:hypothetical protein
MKFKKTIFPLLFLAFLLLNSNVCLGQGVQPITVEVRGVGTNPLEARKDAITNALRQVVGEYIEADTVIENEEIVKDTIAAFTNSSDVKSEILERGFEGDNVFVICKVTIVPSQIVGKIRDAALSAVNIDGEALAAELEANHDNIKLQKDTLHNLFSGLAPRLLVARIVDRNGKPILDGRPPKDDIEMTEQHVGFALNIELYYDLQIYYERVYPNLNKVLRAVSTQYLPAEVQSSIGNPNSTVTAFTNYPNYSKSWATRSEELKMQKNSVDMDVGPQNFVVLLSRSRSRYGAEEGYDAFVLPRELRDSIASTAHEGYGESLEHTTLPRMRVIFESAGGDVLKRSEAAWGVYGGPALGGARNAGGGDREPLPFSEPFKRINSTISTWLFSGTEPVDKRNGSHRSAAPLVISPRFNSGSGTRYPEMGDTILLRWYFVLPKEDFAKIARISFDFWDPRAN